MIFNCGSTLKRGSSLFFGGREMDEENGLVVRVSILLPKETTAAIRKTGKSFQTVVRGALLAAGYPVPEVPRGNPSRRRGYRGTV
jgi:hypothetical protein